MILHPTEHHARQRGGFALMVSIMIMAFMLLLMLSLSTLLQVETLSSKINRDQALAQHNALLGLQIALGTLQDLAGPDQRVSARADLIDPASPNPHWTGIWRSAPPVSFNHTRPVPPLNTAATSNNHVAPSEAYLMSWLVSGNEAPTHLTSADATPSVTPDTNLRPQADFGRDRNASAVYLLGAGTLVESGAPTPDTLAGAVVAPKVAITNTQNQTAGHYAWWVGDEGVKARVQMAGLPSIYNASPTENAIRAHQIPVAGNPAVMSNLGHFDRNSPLIERNATFSDLDLSLGDNAEERQALRQRWHDLSLHSQGLLTDTRWSGLRGDLTHAFESDIVYNRYFNTANGTLYFADVADLGYPAGFANWDILRNYYTLKDDITSAGLRMTMPNPKDIRGQVGFNTTNLPWKDFQASRHDLYQRNSPVLPILARFQVTLGLRFEEDNTAPSGSEPDIRYRAVLLAKPVVALYNPYNVTLRPGLSSGGGSNIYQFHWTAPMEVSLQIGANDPVNFFLIEILGKNDGSSPPETMVFRLPVVEFQPGETRIFTLNTDKQRESSTMWLEAEENIWSETEGFIQLKLWESYPATSAGASTNSSASSYGLTAAEIARLETRNPEDLVTMAITRFTGGAGGIRMNFRNDPGDKDLVARDHWWANHFAHLANHNTLTSNTPDPFSFRVEDAIPASGSPNGPMTNIVTWGFWLKTANETRARSRLLTDTNIRTLTGRRQLDGLGNIYDYMSMYSGEVDGVNVYGFLEDMAPSFSDVERNAGYWGPSTTTIGGVDRVILFDLPREPLLSLGALQHANVSRYNNDPTYVIGHSFVPARLSNQNRAFSTNFTGDSNFDIWDLSWLINQQLWDSYYFSSLPQNLNTTEAGDLIADLSQGSVKLPNHRLSLMGQPDSEDLFARPTGTDDDDSFYRALAHLTVDGAFNINSTSRDAWRALLSSLSDVQIPLYHYRGANAGLFDSLNTTGGVTFSRLFNPVDGAYTGGNDERFWRGHRVLSQSEIDSLADAIVDEITARNKPFATLAEFVNRPLVNGPEGRGGLLQRAIDRAGLNNSIPTPNISGQSAASGASHNPINGSNQGIAFPGYLTQADILQTLAPLISARSDTFTIRSYGDVVNPLTGNIEARAWCEAIVQRLPYETVNQTDVTDRNASRRFVLLNFRWLSPDEV